MADDDLTIFGNLPRRKRRDGYEEEDHARARVRSALSFQNYYREGPLPPRPHPSGRGGSSPATGPPVSGSVPTIIGIPAVGQVLTCSPGGWYGLPTYTYQWNGVAGSPTTNPTYTVVAGDLGNTISCTVTATNAFGSTPATSNAVVIVALPANTSPPVISGATTIGATLTLTSPGVWSGSPTYTYLWSGAGSPNNGSTYVTVTADGGTSVTCQVTATNAAGSASQASNAIAVAGGAAVETVWSASDAAATGMVLTNNGLTATNSDPTSDWWSIRGTTSKSSGKWYVEFLVSTASGLPYVQVGLANAGFSPLGYLGQVSASVGLGMDGASFSSAEFLINYNITAITPIVGDVFGVAVDFDAGHIWLSYNNVWVEGSNPATGALPMVSITGTTGPLFAASASSFGPFAFTLQTETALGRARRLAENHND